MLTVAELLDLVVRLEDDPARRNALDGQPYQFFEAAVNDGLIRDDQMDEFAAVIGEAWQQDALRFRRTQGGAIISAPDKPWTNHAFQSRSGYYSTLTGQQIAALYQERRATAAVPRPATPNDVHDGRDVFICHASEDKDTVAHPLAEALKARGWTVWLDDLELTVGDSLTGSIEAALAQSRFGVAILSPASFAKSWPQRELQGLAARESSAGTKVILPVWHKVDQNYIVARAPILADRIGAKTSEGIARVADQISRALERAGLEAATATGRATNVVQSVEQPDGPTRLAIPTTIAAQDAIIAAQSPHWEWALFAGSLVAGLAALEGKWEDHEMRLALAERRVIADKEVAGYIQSELEWFAKQISILDQILTPEAQVRAFGALGEPGDAARIRSLARRILSVYEALLDEAAAMRSTSVPSRWREFVDVTAEFIDRPLLSIHEFIGATADQIARLPELAANATEEQPVRLVLELSVALDPEVKKRHAKALARLEADASG